MSWIGSELRELRREVVRLNRRIAMARMPGKVTHRDAEKRRVRLELGKDPDSGEPILSPWVPVQSGSAGAFKTFVLPSIGEQLYLENASGVVGADSVAAFGTFTDQNPPPAQEADEAVLFENGGTRIAVKGDQVVLKVGDSSMTLTAAGPAFKGGKLTHDGKDVGSSHRHGGVQRGGSQTDPPS